MLVEFDRVCFRRRLFPKVFGPFQKRSNGFHSIKTFGKDTSSANIRQKRNAEYNNHGKRYGEYVKRRIIFSGGDIFANENVSTGLLR